MAVLLLIIIYITFISLGLPDSLLGSAWPVMRHSLGADLSVAGVLSMIVSGCTIITSLFSDRAVRKFRTGPVTAVSVLLTAAALIGFSAAGSVWWLALMAIPLGIGAGAVDSVLNNFVAIHYKPRHMSWLHCFWGVGALISPLIMARFIDHGNNWRGGYLFTGIIQFAVVVLLFAALPVWRRQDKKLAALEQESEVAAGADLRPSALRIPGVPLAMLTFLTYCAIEALIALWGGSYLAESKGLSPATAARWVSFFFIGITAGRFITGFLTARFTNMQLIRAGGAGVLFGAVLMLLPLSAELALCGLLVMGLGCAPIFPCMIQETPARFGVANSQKIIGLQMASAYTGSTFVPPLLGLVASTKLGIGILPPVLLIFAIATVAASECLNRIVSRKSA